MKRTLSLLVLLLLAAGYVYLQTTAPAPKLAAWMPGGALVYIEAPDFGRLLREWDSSKVKTGWLRSGNYSVFSRSNLFIKLHDVYGHYGDTAGFLPDLKSVLEIAGTDSALALYDLHEVQFLYVSRVDSSALMKSQLWAVREKFEQRQAGGVPFYRHTDAASKWTVAFAFTQGYLLLATRDDLLANALELLAGASNPSIASDRWYRDATAAAATEPGELRMVMNLETLLKSSYFGAYWVQRNTPALRQYWAGVADVRRTPAAITESRVFLNSADAPQPENSSAISELLALAPPDAGLYKASLTGDASETAALVVDKLIAAQPQRAQDPREAPWAASLDNHSGTEGDLETRIDEQPLPAGAGTSESIAAVSAVIEKAGGRACLLVQSSMPAQGTFVQIPAVIVLEGAQDWDQAAVRTALAAAAGNLWTTSQLGALDGLGTLRFAARGHLLFLGNDSTLFAQVLGRAGTNPVSGAAVYAAGFRHLRERPNYQRIMNALDLSSPAGVPSFFSANLGSLSRVLSGVSEVHITEEHRPNTTLQTVRYELAP